MQRKEPEDVLIPVVVDVPAPRYDHSMCGKPRQEFAIIAGMAYWINGLR